MSLIFRALLENFRAAPEINKIELLTTEERRYDSPLIAMATAVEGFLPVPINLNRLSRLTNRTKMSSASVLLAMANYRKLGIRGGGKAFSHHNKMREIDTVFIEEFENAAHEHTKNRKRMIALSSKIYLQGEDRRHLILLDFSCENDEEGMRNAIMVVSRLNLNGILVDSGRSFHFYSQQHFEFEQWVRKMGEALLFSPIVDGAWVAHQLIEGRAALRISEKGNRPLRVAANI